MLCLFSLAYIEITSEYVVDTVSDAQQSEKIDNLHHRVYSYSDGLKRNADIDGKYFSHMNFSTLATIVSFFSYQFHMARQILLFH